MAIEILGLDHYDIIKLGEYKLKIIRSGYGYGSDKMFFLLFPEERTLEEIENIIKNPKNTKKIIISDKEEKDIYLILEGFCEVDNVEKQYQGAYYTNVNEEDESSETFFTDIYRITLNKNTIPSQLTKFQSDLEYVAIMSDIDLDEDIYKD